MKGLERFSSNNKKKKEGNPWITPPSNNVTAMAPSIADVAVEEDMSSYPSLDSKNERSVDDSMTTGVRWFQQKRMEASSTMESQQNEEPTVTTPMEEGTMTTSWNHLPSRVSLSPPNDSGNGTLVQPTRKEHNDDDDENHIVIPGFEPIKKEKVPIYSSGLEVVSMDLTNESRNESNHPRHAWTSKTPPGDDDERKIHSITPQVGGTGTTMLSPKATTSSFDDVLHRFMDDIQTATDLQEQGEKELLDLEVDLSHAMATALRYKGDMMDLLKEMESTKAMVDGMLLAEE